MSVMMPCDAHQLPTSVRSRFVPGVNGLTMHLLEAGRNEPARPAVLLLHGFPELAYSWRNVMPALAAAGYYVIAPDQRGYGRTTGSLDDYDTDLAPFRLANLVRDMLELLAALGRDHVDAVIGHDFGAVVAPWAALIRPDVFRATVVMSAPFAGPPRLGETPVDPVHDDMLALDRPRKHYQWYYSTRPANDEMTRPPQGLHNFLRAYFHHKSADWAGNAPFKLSGWTATELAKIPTYYIMDADKDMPATVAEAMPAPDEIEANTWLPDRDLALYVNEYERTGFQGSLNWYRCRTQGVNDDLKLFAGRTIDVPAAFIGGAQDWGLRQVPGALEAMQESACSDFRGCHLIDGAGHWVQQEQTAAVNDCLLAFLRDLK